MHPFNIQQPNNNQANNHNLLALIGRIWRLIKENPKESLVAGIGLASFIAYCASSSDSKKDKFDKDKFIKDSWRDLHPDKSTHDNIEIHPDDLIKSYIMGSYLNLDQIQEITQYGSTKYGHAYPYPGYDKNNPDASFKDYFIPKGDGANWNELEIKSPIKGKVVKIEKEQLKNSGYQITIQSSEDPNLLVNIFHVNIENLTEGQELNENHKLGYHIGDQTFSDISVWKNGKPASYINLLNDEDFIQLATNFKINSKDETLELMTEEEKERLNDYIKNGIITKEDLLNLRQDYCCAALKNNSPTIGQNQNSR